jgi:hypothetical protein
LENILDAQTIAYNRPKYLGSKLAAAQGFGYHSWRTDASCFNFH